MKNTLIIALLIFTLSAFGQKKKDQPQQQASPSPAIAAATIDSKVAGMKKFPDSLNSTLMRGKTKCIWLLTSSIQNSYMSNR
ncbi:MAG: hypothetical protein IPK96_05390 [Flammeovirgaceae bacterium]|nr:hypothetical protein [Flammeovirgaceae bacterium]